MEDNKTDNDKIPAPVRKITLDINTYHEESVTPTLINFFFGKNGVGKSTIANSFKGDKDSISPDVSQYEILVYNQDFVKKEIQEDKEMPGVFSMNKEDIEKQNQISVKQDELNSVKTDCAEKKKIKAEKITVPASLRTDLETKFWSLTNTARTDFPRAIKGKISGRLTKADFCTTLLKESAATEAIMKDLKSLYDVAFGTDSTTYAELKMPRPVNESKIEGFDLLADEILSSSDKPYAQFIKAIGATDWLKHSHDKFSSDADGKCPYCMKKLDEDFEEQFAACFDEQYQESIAKVKTFISEYAKKTATVLTTLENNKINAYPKIDFSTYDDKLSTIKATIELNKKRLADKVAAPAAKISLDNIDKQITEINALTEGFNKDIKKYNEIIGSRKTKQKECTDAVWQHMAFLVKEAKAFHDKQITDNKVEVDTLESDITKLEQRGKILSNEISNLTNEIKGVDSTMIAINKTLRDSGFQGFHLKKKGHADADKNRYVIVRDDNSIAKGLSEGERNFMAFLYFYHRVFGRESSNGEFKDRIVVIDDPVSSMDSSALFIVSSLIRNLIGICYNNGKPAHRDAPRFIKQLFVLTHNAYFLQEISYDRIKNHQAVNFYLIKKNNNTSKINLCWKEDELGLKHNYSPVQNSYAALWHEYKEVKSAIALKRVMRHILEYYFIQVSGFQEQDLHSRIFRDETLFNDAKGFRDDSLIHSVNMLLQYIGSNQQGFNDGFDYVDDTEDIDALKSAFVKIFEAVGQDQHYRMMIENV